MSAKLEPQALVIVHLKTYVPIDGTVAVEVAFVLLLNVIVPVGPEILVQAPEPELGVLPPNEVEVSDPLIVIATPTVANGVLFTTCVLEAVVVPQDPPEVVKINVAVPEKAAGGVHVVVLGNVPPLFVNVPPEVVAQTALVALPPYEPPNGTDVPP